MLLVSGVVYRYRGTVPSAPRTANGVEAEVYLSSGVGQPPNRHRPGVLEQFPIATPEGGGSGSLRLRKEGFTIARPAAGSAHQPRAGPARDAAQLAPMRP